MIKMSRSRPNNDTSLAIHSSNRSSLSRRSFSIATRWLFSTPHRQILNDISKPSQESARIPCGSHADMCDESSRRSDFPFYSTTSRRFGVPRLRASLARSPLYHNQESSSHGAFTMQDRLILQDRIAYQGITFDDVLLEPGYSEVLPRDVDVRTMLTRRIRLNIPIVSSPMDTVTESELAIALAQEGGIGIIHKNMVISAQAREVEKVKRSENGIITDPVTLSPDETVETARKIMEVQHISGIPITVKGQLKGIITKRDLRFITENHRRLAEVMTRENLVTALENTTLEAAERILTENKVEKLLLVDEK